MELQGGGSTKNYIATISAIYYPKGGGKTLNEVSFKCDMAIDTHCAAMKPFVQSFSPGNCEGYEQRVRSACFAGSLQPWGNRLWQAPVQRANP